jgi:hypothetical protein
MSEKDQPKQEAPKKEQANQSYFFPNVGEGTPFSFEAKDFDTAVEANKKHLKENK